MSRMEAPMSMTVCPNCGRTAEEGAKFCSRCGQAIPEPRQTAPEPHARPPRARTVPIIPFAILGAGILALVLVLLLVRGNPPAGEVLSEPSAPAPTVPVVVGGTLPGPAQETTIPSPAPAVVAVAPTAVPPERAHRPTPTPPIEQVYECRLGAIFGVDPEETLVTINGKLIGTADDWDDAGGGQKYEFDRPGTYFVKLSLAGYRTTWIKIVVRPLAEEAYADVDLELKKLGED
jgi:hypothetical protein